MEDGKSDLAEANGRECVEADGRWDGSSRQADAVVQSSAVAE